MLDVVKYSNKSNQLYNVAEHIDPGLFAISLFSDVQGLELKEMNGKWVQVPYGKQQY